MLTAAGAEVDEAEVLESVANHSRFDVFALADAVLAGETARAFKILWGLRAEGVAPVLISWALNRDIGLLSRLDYAVRHGDNLDGALMRQGVWRRRQTLVKQATRALQDAPARGAAPAGEPSRRGAQRRVPRRAVGHAHGAARRDAASARAKGARTEGASGDDLTARAHAADRHLRRDVRSDSLWALAHGARGRAVTRARARALRAVREPAASRRADDQRQAPPQAREGRDPRRADVRRRRPRDRAHRDRHIPWIRLRASARNFRAARCVCCSVWTRFSDCRRGIAGASC